MTKTKYVQKMEKTQIKECWHQNVTACHETYVTEFRPNQERQCEENFWKACKISFKERSFNYTLRYLNYSYIFFWGNVCVTRAKFAGPA